MALSDIVVVSISALTVVPSRVGFGTPLILDYHTRFAERARSYTSLAGMTADGFLTTDAAYKMAAKIFSQNPKVRQVIVGRAAFAPTQREDITPIAQNSHTYTVTIDGFVATFDSDASATVAEICTGITTAINAVMPATTVLATDNVTKVTLLSELAGRLFELDVARVDWIRDDTGVDPGIVADLTAITIVNDDYYTIHPTYNGTLSAIALAAAVEAVKKLLIINSGDDDILTGAGLGDALKTSAYARTALMYSRLPHEYPAAAWAGKLLPKDPGSATWKFKTLAGITADDGFTATQLTAMRADNVNFYHTIAGVNITEEGTSASGEFIDVTQGIDWLAQRLMERIFGKLANADKIPFTDTGIAVVEAEVRAQLQEAINNTFLASDPAPTVTVPLAADVSALDKGNRLLPDIEFSATLAGAVHSVEISGNVTL